MGGLYSRPKATSMQKAEISSTPSFKSSSLDSHSLKAALLLKAAPSEAASLLNAETASPGLLSMDSTAAAKRSRDDPGNGNKMTTSKKPKTTQSDNLLESLFDSDSYRDVVTDASLCHGRFTVCNLRGNPSPLFQQQQGLHQESFYCAPASSSSSSIDLSNDDKENEMISNADECSANGLSSSAWTCESWSSDNDESLVDDLELLSHLDFVLE